LHHTKLVFETESKLKTEQHSIASLMAGCTAFQCGL